MKRHNVILESSLEPKDKNVLWLHGKKLKKFGKTGWEDIGNEALALGAFYGYFPDSSSLPTDVATPGYAYVGLDNPYKIWKFNGELWSDSGTYIDVNDVDEEDITRNTDGKLQFKDRVYGDGMGYIILRKDKTFAEQVTKENTIYEIRYDFNLENITKELPNGCCLRFNGGSLSNGRILFNGAIIDAPCVPIFKNINTISDDVDAPTKQDVTYLDWFEFDAEEGQHRAYVMAMTIGKKVVCTKSKTYHFRKCYTGSAPSFIIKHDVELQGNGATFDFAETFPDNTNYPDILYHSACLIMRDLDVVWRPEDNTRVISGETKNKQCRFASSSTYSAAAKAYLDNIHIRTTGKDHGLNGIYETYCGKEFVINNCSLISEKSNDYSIGGAFAWFMFNDNASSNISVKIVDCYIKTGGKDEAVLISTSSRTLACDIRGEIRNTYLENINPSYCFSVLNLAPISPATGTETKTLKILIDTCTLVNAQENGEKNLLFIKSSGMNIDAKFINTTFTSSYNYNEPTHHDGMLALLTGSVKADFWNCSFDSKYIYNTQTGTAASGLSFRNCKFVCDSIVKTLRHSDVVSIPNVYEDCDIEIRAYPTHIEPLYAIFRRCNFNTGENALAFHTSRHDSKPSIEFYDCQQNGLKLPNIDKYSIFAENDYSYNWSPFINNTMVFFGWMNNLGIDVVININGKDYAVSAGERINVGKIGDKLPMGTDFPVIINGHMRYIHIDTIENYNDRLNSGYVVTMPTSIRPSSACQGQVIYDSTLKKRIMWNGTEWINLDGSVK